MQAADTVTEGERSSMTVPYVTSFLWCLSLQMGTKFISILHFGLSTALVVLCSGMAVEAHELVGGDEDADFLYTKTFYATLVVAVISVMHVVLSCTLLYGVFGRKTTALRLWVMVMLALYAAAVLFIVVTAIVCGFTATGSDIFLSFFEGLLLFTFIGYCILCVYSYYLMLKSLEDMERPNKADY